MVGGDGENRALDKGLTLGEAERSWSCEQWAEWFLGQGLNLPHRLRVRLMERGVDPAVLAARMAKRIH